MKDSCVIKSSAHGINLILNPDIPFEDLVRDVCAKFAEARDFFGKVSFVIEFEGRELTGEEAAVLVEAVELNSDITIKLISEKSELKDRDMFGRIERFHYDRIFESAHIIMDSIASDENFHTDNSVVILGDIRDGGVVTAVGNIICYGSIYGEAHAGCEGNSDCYIVAGSYEGGDISIGDVSGHPEIKKKKMFQKKTSHADAVAICVWDGVLTSDPINLGILKDIRDRRG